MTELALVTVERTPDAFAEAIHAAVKRPALSALFGSFGSGAESRSASLAILPEDDFAKAVVERVNGLRRAAPEQADVLCLTHGERGALHQALHAQLERTNGTVIIPRTAGHGLARPLFLISIPKAGTHLLYRLAEELGFKPGVICPDIPTPGYWYCLEYSNSHTVPRDFFVDSVRRAPFGNRMHPFPYTPALFIVRHPWDILVSEANYYAKPGNSPFSGFYDGLDFEARTIRLLDDGLMLGRFCERVLAFEPWLHFDNVIPLAFEDIVGAAGGGDVGRQQRLIWSVQVKLGTPGAPADISGRLFDKASPTFHEGRIGSHRTALPAALRERLDSVNADVLQAYGYQSFDSPYTAYAENWRKRPLLFTENKLDATPVGVETNYWGHNLVRYRSRFYAVPMALGPFDLASEEKRLESLPNADNLSALRDIVIKRLLTDELRTRLKSLEEALEERTHRIHSLETTMGERNTRLQALEKAIGDRSRRS
jgi:hypothetical protein